MKLSAFALTLQPAGGAVEPGATECERKNLQCISTGLNEDFLL